jgi:hypothetical protein
MTTKTISAEQNPALANKLAAEALAPEKETIAPAAISTPSFNNLVTLPGGYLTMTGEVIREVEVKELTGKDEEAIARTNDASKLFNTIINRGTVRVGKEDADESILDRLLAGDRDEIVIGIFRATFGNEVDVNAYCSGCNESKVATVDVSKDIKSRVLLDPVEDRVFVVKSRGNEFKVTLPTGAVQKELLSSSGKSIPELTTMLLEQTVLEINGQPVFHAQQVRDLGLVDRRAISNAIAERNPGPQLEDVITECPDCGGKVVVPINLGTLFRF